MQSIKSASIFKVSKDLNTYLYDVNTHQIFHPLLKKYYQKLIISIQLTTRIFEQ